MVAEDASGNSEQTTKLCSWGLNRICADTSCPLRFSLAMAEMKILLQDIYSRFTTYPDESMTAESMEMSDQLISSRPLGQRCFLRFVPLGVDVGADMGADKA